MEAQRKVSQAVVGSGQRERRNSFREAVESKKKPYESIWFSKGGEEDMEDEGSTTHHYVNTEVKNVQYIPEDAKEPGEGPHGYEPITFKDGKVTRMSPKLQSVSLVSEVMNRGYANGSKQPVKKQNSNSSAASSGSVKGPPPPYKQPPQVLSQVGPPRRRQSPVTAKQQVMIPRQMPDSAHHYQNVGTYANVPLRQPSKERGKLTAVCYPTQVL